MDREDETSAERRARFINDRARRTTGEYYAADIMADEELVALLESPEAIELRELALLSIEIEELLGRPLSETLRAQREQQLQSDTMRMLGFSDDGELDEGERDVDEQLDQLERAYNDRVASAEWIPSRRRGA